jgi:hypothetical protein
MTGSSNAAPPVKSARSCVLYDSDSGRILHIHQAVVLEGGETPTKAEMERTAFEMLDSHDAEPSKVAALHLGHADFKPATAYTVDIATKALVERALPPRRASRFRG